MKTFLPVGLLLFFLLFGCQAVEERVSGEEQRSLPENMLLEINDERRFVSVEEVADLIINQDPSLRLVDLRNHTSYDRYALPGAVNIPLGQILESDSRDQLDCERYRIVFYSNDDLYAEQAWFLLRQQGCVNLYIMEGGLNQWVESILNPQEPPPTAPKEAFELYSLRKAAAKYFVGGSRELEAEPYVEPVKVIRSESEPQAQKKQEVKPKKKPQKLIFEEEEGC